MEKKKICIAIGAIFIGICTYIFFSHKNGIEQGLVLFGNVDIREVDLSFRVGGKVSALFFEEGDKIAQGDLLASLDDQPYSDKVIKAKNEAESIHISLINAQKQLERRKMAIKNKAVSEEDVEDASAKCNELAKKLLASIANVDITNTDLQDTNLIAPSEGVILTRIRERGSVVQAGEPIYTLSLNSPIWIRSYIPEPDLGRIYPGKKAQIFTDTKTNRIYQGHVGFISPLAEFTPKTVETPQLRTDLVFRLRVIVDDPDDGLRQGMPVTIKFLNEDLRSKEPNH